MQKDCQSLGVGISQFLPKKTSLQMPTRFSNFHTQVNDFLHREKDVAEFDFPGHLVLML